MAVPSTAFLIIVLGVIAFTDSDDEAELTRFAVLLGVVAVAGIVLFFLVRRHRLWTWLATLVILAALAVVLVVSALGEAGRIAFFVALPVVVAFVLLLHPRIVRHYVGGRRGRGRRVG